MLTEKNTQSNVKQAVPFFSVTDMAASLGFYVDGLGFVMKHKWIDEGKLRWCWLEIGDAAIMLQEFRREGHDSWTPEGKLGVGVNICFQCNDAIAIFKDARARGIAASLPIVGNGMWVTDIYDPDGYRLEFESLTDVPESTQYSEEGSEMSIYSYKFNDAGGKEISLASYKHKVLLIVNTASKCGHTPQYAGLQKIYSELKQSGLEILAFPCDQFGHQEPGTNDEIQQFCQVNYGVTFPVFAKIEVNGENAHPLYRYLRSLKASPQGDLIQWNFTKFLVDRDGKLVERFEPAVKPEELVEEIRKLLSSNE